MIVFVMSRRQLDAAWQHWIDAADCDAARRQRQALRKVSDTFFDSPDARVLRAPSGLYSFTLDDVLRTSRQWFDAQVLLQPDKADAIRSWQRRFDAHWGCWGIGAKLVVRECLSTDDFEACSEAGTDESVAA